MKVNITPQKSNILISQASSRCTKQYKWLIHDFQDLCLQPVRIKPARNFYEISQDMSDHKVLWGCRQCYLDRISVCQLSRLIRNTTLWCPPSQRELANQELLTAQEEIGSILGKPVYLSPTFASLQNVDSLISASQNVYGLIFKEKIPNNPQQNNRNWC